MLVLLFFDVAGIPSVESTVVCVLTVVDALTVASIHSVAGVPYIYWCSAVAGVIAIIVAIYLHGSLCLCIHVCRHNEQIELLLTEYRTTAIRMMFFCYHNIKSDRGI